MIHLLHIKDGTISPVPDSIYFERDTPTLGRIFHSHRTAHNTIRPDTWTLCTSSTMHASMVETRIKFAPYVLREPKLLAAHLIVDKSIIP